MSEIATLPQGMDNLTNKQVNSLQITGYAGRNKWETVCNKCGSVTVKPHTALVSGSAKCRFDACSLNRLEPTKVSKHEAWLNSTEPEKKPEPASVPVVIPELTAEYRQYRRHAVVEWGYSSGDGKLIECADWQQLPEFAKEKMLAIIAKEEK